MNMVIPNEGLLLWLLWALNNSDTVQEDFVLDLFQNDYAPSDTSTAADFTVSTFPGYGQIALARNTFTDITATDGVGTAVSTVSPVWTCTGGTGQLAYGWYMRGAASNKVLAAQNFQYVRTMYPNTSENLGPFTMEMGQFGAMGAALRKLRQQMTAAVAGDADPATIAGE